ncbi:unnamed protein product [Menidia menidia]|uniref:(Atlantic silverside) hypothetical protein n=1 Tax=Menidia menidia TaxID=238744 RepID=A0A8S4BCE1_9TELE|nr:unnamed protein product [Menidia menidia]
MVAGDHWGDASVHWKDAGGHWRDADGHWRDNRGSGRTPVSIGWTPATIERTPASIFGTPKTTGGTLAATGGTPRDGKGTRNEGGTPREGRGAESGTQSLGRVAGGVLQGAQLQAGAGLLGGRLQGVQVQVWVRVRVRVRVHAAQGAGLQQQLPPLLLTLLLLLILLFWGEKGRRMRWKEPKLAALRRRRALTFMRTISSGMFIMAPVNQFSRLLANFQGPFVPPLSEPIQSAPAALIAPPSPRRGACVSLGSRDSLGMGRSTSGIRISTSVWYSRSKSTNSGSGLDASAGDTERQKHT